MITWTLRGFSCTHHGYDSPYSREKISDEDTCWQIRSSSRVIAHMVLRDVDDDDDDDDEDDVCEENVGPICDIVGTHAMEISSLLSSSAHEMRSEM